MQRNTRKLSRVERSLQLIISQLDALYERVNNRNWERHERRYDRWQNGENTWRENLRNRFFLTD